ncbi:MAG: Do family serine endopeptidase [Gemmatimonadota bacterium]|nr:Do family serine endopeptidase [Gemmatimonadota bacterium]MDE2828618.1 Do family serine endopeptidase [Gemmatimonadota bacterium]
MKHRTIALLGLIALLLSAYTGEAALTPEEKQAITQIKAYNTAFKAIAKEVTPSVVTINVTLSAENMPRRRGFPFPFDFEERPNRRPDRRPQPMPDPQTTGSGIVITADGYILTNHHVAGDAEKLTVTFSDNREYDAELVGSDPRTDIAVIKIDATGLKPATIGKSDAVEIGEWVLAVGAPLNLKSTVTAGIVSAVGRDINIINDQGGLSIEDFIQTDAAINPGNSGGALVNLNGEVIGVNTAIATSNRSFIGYGFAVPIDLAKKVMDDIVEHGKVKRGYIGIGLDPVDAGKAEAFGLDRPKGVLISRVYPNTPAAKANLKEGDIVLSVDGQPVNRPNHLQSLVARKHPGDTVTLAVRRNTKDLTIRVTLGERLPEEIASADDAPEKEKENASVSEIGLTVHDITAKMIEEYTLPENTTGVVVTNVSREARNAGFSEGDIIYGVRQSPFQQDIKTVHDFETAVSKLKKGKNAAFSVITRDGGRRFLSLKI